jgi:hypothetical protein
MNTRHLLKSLTLTSLSPALLCAESLISGSVADTAGNIMKGVQVVAVQIENGTNHESQTDGAGHFCLSNLPNGIYRLRFEKTGYRPVEVQQLTLAANETLQKQIQMKATGTGEEAEADRRRAALKPAANRLTMSVAGNLSDQAADQCRTGRLAAAR